MATTPVLTAFEVPPRTFGSVSTFELPIPSSPNTVGAFTFTSSDTTVASISGRIVTILKSGTTLITATQAATPPTYNSASISRSFTVNVAIPTLSGFTIPTKFFNDVSFTLTNPTSNSNGVFAFESLTPTTISINGRVATIKRVGPAIIRATQFPATNYATATIDASFNILTSIVRVGVQNQIDLSWNRPLENGATIKNYFFVVEERATASIDAPVINRSYYSYALPVPYSEALLSSSGSATGLVINDTNYNTQTTITVSPTPTTKNYFNLGYYGEIEISWEYNEPILSISPTSVSSTAITLNLWKTASITDGTRRYFLRNIERIYNSNTNCLGPRPQNSGKIMTDIFTIDFEDDSTATTILNTTDTISGNCVFSSISYTNGVGTVITYSITLKSLRIAPYRFPLTRDFTSLGFGLGSDTADPRVGFTISTSNASAPQSPGILYHMPEMTRPLLDFNEAKWTFSWNYAANLSRIATDISFLPISSGLISDLMIPFQLRIRGYSRSYTKPLLLSSETTDASYNTTNVATFLSNLLDSRFSTRPLFDVVIDTSASYTHILNETTTVITRTFDISGLSTMATTATTISHTQFVFLFNLTIPDPSYNAYFKTSDFLTDDTNAFRVKMLSQTFAPLQEYRFSGPDPTLASSNSLTSTTNTIYNIVNPYTNIRPFYRFYNLINGQFYSFKISGNNRVGTSAFSETFTRRCGSIPNQIVNTIVNERDTLIIESEKTSNQVNIYWNTPAFSGYEIQKYIIQMDIDISGRWLNIFEYTPDVSHDSIQFNTFVDYDVPVPPASTEPQKVITSFTKKTDGSTGPLINGSKYYFRIASINELGTSLYSPVLSGIPFSAPINAPITFVGTIVGDKVIYISWKIPIDDAGSPILNYVIEYKNLTIPGSVARQFRIDADEPTGDPYGNFFEVYTKYKNLSSLTASEQTRITNLRTKLIKYIIPPVPIILNDADAIITPLTNPPIPNRNIQMTFTPETTQQTFTYISAELTQNVFDISNIQLKWYYYQGTGNWDTDSIEVSFKLTIRGHLKDVSGNSARDINNLFYISSYEPGGVTYKVNRTMFSSQPVFKYIDYTTGGILPGSDSTLVPKIMIPTLPRIDSYNGQRYRLHLVYDISYVPQGNNGFIFYSGAVIINGTSPVRTNPSINTIFTVKIQDSVVNPLDNQNYQFKITPFNMSAYFPADKNIVDMLIGTNNAAPVSDVSYSLISTEQGGRITLRWKYSPPSDYYINITVPPEYVNDLEYPNEYKERTESDGTILSILATSLTPNNQIDQIVSYDIPSVIPSDIQQNNAQKYLKSGRGYNITVRPVKRIIDTNNNVISLAAPARNINVSGYIVPFRIPLRPLSLSANGNNGRVSLSWVLPDIQSDPNYYITSYNASTTALGRPLPFYSYKFYTLEYRNMSSSTQSWITISDIPIPAGATAGTIATYTVTGLTNENNHQFRVNLMIVNEYNAQRAVSAYSHLSNINNAIVEESSGNTIYPSRFPYKPSAPKMIFANRNSAQGRFDQLIVRFGNPDYTGNADYYDVFIEYTQPRGTTGSGTVWVDIFDIQNGIAIRPADSLTTSSSSVDDIQNLIIVCKTAITVGYGIRIRLLGRITLITDTNPIVLYSDYSSEDYIDL
jgi:hypothetical protein